MLYVNYILIKLEWKFTKSNIRQINGNLIFSSSTEASLQFMFNYSRNKNPSGTRKKKRKLTYISIFYFRHRVCVRLKMATHSLQLILSRSGISPPLNTAKPVTRFHRMQSRGFCVSPAWNGAPWKQI